MILGEAVYAEPGLVLPSLEDRADFELPPGMNPLTWMLLDFEAFCYVNVKVPDKQTLKPVRLVLKPVQRKLARYLVECLISGEPIRAIILKARREGMSTVIQAFMYWRCSTRPEQHALTIAHDTETSKYLHGMAERFYRYHPRAFRPDKETSVRGQILKFGNGSKSEKDREQNPGLQSSMRTASLENAGAGTGVLYLHLSEFARWEGTTGEDASTTALQTVPDSPGTMIIIESTAQGASGEFYDMWQEAEQAENGYKPFFFAWWEEPTYTARAVHDFVRTPQEEEVARLARARGYILGDDQLQWRRNTIRVKCKGKLATFHQEYPSVPEEAFLTSGRPYFDARLVAQYREECRQIEPIRRGMLRVTDSDRPLVKFADNEEGFVKVWEDPLPDEEYLIFADCAAGTGDEGDYQAAFVMPRSRMDIVASWHGKIGRNEFADELRYLGKIYAGASWGTSRVGALIAVETTGGWGEAVVSVLKREGYPNLYRRNRNENARKRRRSEAYGWETTPRTRALMLDALDEAIRDHDLGMNDRGLAEECRTFIYGNDGKPQAQQGSHDDRVIAAAGVVYLWLTEPRIHRVGRAEHKRREPVSAVAGY